MPLLVGCAAMAEERKMATLESQLCLPVKRWTQFRIKFLVVLMFSVALGAVMPWLLEGGRILPGIKLHGGRLTELRVRIDFHAWIILLLCGE